MVYLVSSLPRHVLKRSGNSLFQFEVGFIRSIREIRPSFTQAARPRRELVGLSERMESPELC